MILPGVPTTMSSPFLIAPAERVTTNKNQQSDSVLFKNLFIDFSIIFPWLEATSLSIWRHSQALWPLQIS